MDPEIKQQFEELHALAKDNYRMIRSIRRSQRLSFLSTIIIWIVVLALPLYLYQQYLQPVITKISANSGMSTTTTSGLLGLPTFNEIGNLVNSAKSKL
jgi:hypothetical protein